MDLIVRDATLPDGRSGIDIGIKDGKIAAVEAGLSANAGEEAREIRENGAASPPSGPARSRAGQGWVSSEFMVWCLTP